VEVRVFSAAPNFQSKLVKQIFLVGLDLSVQIFAAGSKQECINDPTLLADCPYPYFHLPLLLLSLFGAQIALTSDELLHELMAQRQSLFDQMLCCYFVVVHIHNM
jgi:hypothetical protein